MSAAPVDVRAVLLALLVELDDEQGELAEQAREARAAVAELIEQGRKILAALDEAEANRGHCPMSRDEMRHRLAAALDRVGGGS